MHESETVLKNAKWNAFSAEVLIGTTIRPFHFMHESGTMRLVDHSRLDGAGDVFEYLESFF